MNGTLGYKIWTNYGRVTDRVTSWVSSRTYFHENYLPIRLLTYLLERVVSSWSIRLLSVTKTRLKELKFSSRYPHGWTECPDPSPRLGRHHRSRMYRNKSLDGINKEHTRTRSNKETWTLKGKHFTPYYK